MPGPRQYGYFQCPPCNAKWESAQVFSISNGVNGPYYQQDCKKCKIPCSPYRVEPLQCPNCGQQVCCCPDRSTEQHVNSRKAHLRDHCHKCRAGYPCGN